MLKGIGQALVATRLRIRQGVQELTAGGRTIDPDRLEALEAVLLEADIGIQSTQKLLSGVRDWVRQGAPIDSAGLETHLQSELLKILDSVQGNPNQELRQPNVILMVGINGVGKTTTIGKLAHRFQHQGKSVLLVAGDTFRAAAVGQLEVWGNRVGCPVIKSHTGSDPSAVIFDGLSAARSRGSDVVIVDTAGRMHTRFNLMEELKKIKRVMDKALAGSPNETLLVVDATTGQNALSQARKFHDAIGLTALVLTKLDGTARGGVVIAVTQELGVPVKWVGVGEGVEDLEGFSAEAFVKGLFGT